MKTKTYVDDTDEVFVANSARDLLRQIRARSVLDTETNQASWMRGVARRVRQTTGRRLDTQSEAEFVRGLIRAGLLREETEPMPPIQGSFK